MSKVRHKAYETLQMDLLKIKDTKNIIRYSITILYRF